MGLFSRRPSQIVKWAQLGEIIPLQCKKCGAVFVTRNNEYLGYKPVHYGDDEAKCSKCEQMGHRLRDWVPNKALHVQGRWK